MVSPARAPVVLILAMVLVGGCGSGGGDADQQRPPEGRACTLLSADEVESFLGEAANRGKPDDPSEGVTDTCRWGDADPAAPGRILSITMLPAASVDRPRPAEGDNVYEVPELGEGAIGLQLAGGGVRVSFTAEGTRVDMEYDVLPVSAMEADGIDRLIRLAGRVHTRLLSGD